MYVAEISTNITVFLLSKLMTVEFYGVLHLKIGSWGHQLCHIRVDNIAFVIWENLCGSPQGWWKLVSSSYRVHDVASEGTQVHRELSFLWSPNQIECAINL